MLKRSSQGLVVRNGFGGEEGAVVDAEGGDAWADVQRIAAVGIAEVFGEASPDVLAMLAAVT